MSSQTSCHSGNLGGLEAGAKQCLFELNRYLFSLKTKQDNKIASSSGGLQPEDIFHLFEEILDKRNRMLELDVGGGPYKVPLHCYSCTKKIILAMNENLALQDLEKAQENMHGWFTTLENYEDGKAGFLYL